MEIRRGDKKERKTFREEEMNLGANVSESRVAGARNRESRGGVG